VGRLISRRFPRHGAREQKNGAAIHQCIRHVIKAVETGTFHDCDGHVGEQNKRCPIGGAAGARETFETPNVW
jgi:hypothetical protein